MEELMKKLREFRDKRDWKQFHSGTTLSNSVAIEAAELLEVFQWEGFQEVDTELVKEELADVMLYCLLLADFYHLDPLEIMKNKLQKNEEKYPVEKAKGTSKKYNKL